jgi:triacylglycerol esterase/lipase EstA (alpha/beta hydrolase family)
MRLPSEIGGRPIDVFAIKYTTQLVSWLRRDIASLDDVVYSIFSALYPEDPAEPRPLDPQRYRSVGFIAHSLGGNVAAALLHTVKTELGHGARARYGYMITLGTPVNGAQIANVGLILKRQLGMRDPLLQSLERDNTFVRMLTHWRRSENVKAARFRCRRVALYAGIEGRRLFNFLTVVPERSAIKPLQELHLSGDFKWFPNHDHKTIAKPIDENDEVYDWVNRMIARQMGELDDWEAHHTDQSGLCAQLVDPLN